MRLSSQVRVKNEGNCGEMLMKIYLSPETQDEVQFLHVSTTNFRLYRAFMCVRCEIVYLGNFSNEKTLFSFHSRRPFVLFIFQHLIPFRLTEKWN